MTTHAYELVDSTDEEHYYALGLFLTEADALAALSMENPPSPDWYEFATVELRRRPIGLYPHDYTTIATRTWTYEYPEDDSAPHWVAGPIERKSSNESS